VRLADARAALSNAPGVEIMYSSGNSAPLAREVQLLIKRHNLRCLSLSPPLLPLPPPPPPALFFFGVFLDVARRACARVVLRMLSLHMHA
jgi:hypothetical protein